MYDRYNRKIDYLRISVTDKCNLRCYYCMPEEGIRLLNHRDILSYEEIAGFARYAVSQGIRKIRLTGGEPLVRRQITTLVRMLASIKDLEDLAMTTNGMLLEDYADALSKAGLQRVNVSLDSLKPEKYRNITRGGQVDKVRRGIVAAERAGLTPIKINAVMHRYFDDHDRKELLEFGKQNGFQVRFIREMNLVRGTFSVVEGGTGGDCAHCNRLRLTPDGQMKPCLFSNQAFDVRALGPAEGLRRALANKPLSGSVNTACSFNRMGG